MYFIPLTVSQKWEWVHSLFPVRSLLPAGVVTCGKGQDWNACLFGEFRNVPLGPSIGLYVKLQTAESVGRITATPSLERLLISSESGNIAPWHKAGNRCHIQLSGAGTGLSSATLCDLGTAPQMSSDPPSVTLDEPGRIADF